MKTLYNRSNNTESAVNGIFCEFKKANIKDILELNEALRSKNLYDQLRELQKLSLFHSIRAILSDWLIIFLAWWLSAYVSLYFLPISILIIGNRQRALGNLLHEAGHLLLGKGKWQNDLIAELLVAPALFNLMSRYRELHKCHHVCLGSVRVDPDFIHERYYFYLSWIEILLLKLFSWSMWKSSFFGYTFELSWKDQLKILLWWAFILSSIVILTSPDKAIIFASLWIFSKATIFHFITVFREISDHVGLVPGSLIGFTRNAPTTGIARFFFHPHNNGYHLAHHLGQGVPFFALPQAHQLFMNYEKYKNGYHCDGYFWGKRPVVQGWTGAHIKDRANEEDYPAKIMIAH